MTSQNSLELFGAALGPIISGGAVVLGLSSWLGRVWANRISESERAHHTHLLEELKAEASRRLEHQRQETKRAMQDLQERSNVLLKRLDDELGRARYVHSLQFQREFELYTKTWAALVVVRNKALALRPMFDQFDPKESEAQRKQRRQKEFAEAFNPFIQLVNENEPFYPEAVFRGISELARAMRFESIDYQYLDARSEGSRREYWEGQAKNANEILARVTEIAAAIRNRIGLINNLEEKSPQPA